MNPISTSIACLGLALACSAQMVWEERKSATSPAGRYGHIMAYDSSRQRVVLFGGWNGSYLKDTWEWDGKNWTEIKPTTSLSGRVAPAMVYDSARKRIVLFGGEGKTPRRSSLGDTWEWDGKNWTEIKPSASPPARMNHTMAYDSARNRTVLFGGGDYSSNLRGDTWEWDGKNWTEIKPATSPPPRRAHSMVYDSARKRTVLFGGDEFSAKLWGDTWEWDGKNWTQIMPATSPPPRTMHPMVYDSARERTVLFGGGEFSSKKWGDTWEWDGKDWTQIKPMISSPSARTAPEMAYDSARGRTILFGGFSRLGDTWEYYAPTLASYSVFGKGCAATTTPTALSATTPPKIDTTFNLRVSNLRPLTPGILLFGFSDKTWGGIPLPLDLAFLGMQGCNLLVSWDLEANFTSSRAGGSLDFPIPIPGSPSLAGLTFYNQAWVIDGKANAFGVGTSNGGKGVIGY